MGKDVLDGKHMVFSLNGQITVRCSHPGSPGNMYGVRGGSSEWSVRECLDGNYRPATSEEVKHLETVVKKSAVK